MRRIWLILASLAVVITATGQTAYSFRYWTDNDRSTLKTGEGTGEKSFNLDISNMKAGFHVLHIQGRTASGGWTPVRTRYFYKAEQTSVTTARYWFDNDPTTFHEGVATSGLIDLDISHLATGLHAVHYQTLDGKGNVSSARTRYFYVDQVQIGALSALIGIDNGEPTEYELSEEDIVIDILEFPVGWHDLHVTLKDSGGRIIGQQTQQFYIPVPTATITIGMAGEGTYCFDHDLDFSRSNDIRAYIASGYFPQTGHVLLTRALEVPAGTGIVVRGEQGTYKVPFGESSAYYLNLLVGNVERTTVQPTEGSYVNLLLAEGADGLGFYPVTSPVVLEANSARLQLPANLFSSGSNVKIAYEEDADGIIDVTGNGEFSTGLRDVYDLQGRRQNAPQRGINIIRMNDGTTKKVLIK